MLPTEYPHPNGAFDDELFDLCRNDDYAGLYAALIRRAKMTPVEYAKFLRDQGAH